MQPIKLQRERKLSGAWTPKGKVWFQKNDDSKRWDNASENEEKFERLETSKGDSILTNLTKSDRFKKAKVY